MTSSKPADALTIEQQICYAMHTTVRAFDAVYRELLAEHGLSYPQYIALMAIGEHGPLTVGALGELMRLDSGTLSPLLKRMEAAGLVGRTRDRADERRVLVALTDLGRDRLAGVSEVPRAIAARSGLTLSQLAELRSTLERLTATLETARP
ncbi:MarR family winged helix-turn-helix transcriptional regulator [Humibacillus xanthopallidus]|uniref:DNA-binding MarR family transcriptional regulator n=1 Tax=Humibacillus xanthopallidus TaxID=412689 RepID=A0A543HJ77_9MICO|nr:MarR family transcriptional regulator [Humibacillus xanthopallidus]TQM58401.1 DNA-binding MarR family transcriptional regulator [Humibacillus xanthopallidus]